MLPDVRSSTDLPNTCGLYAMLDRTHERRRLRAAAAFLAERERAAARRGLMARVNTSSMKLVEIRPL